MLDSKTDNATPLFDKEPQLVDLQWDNRDGVYGGINMIVEALESHLFEQSIQERIEAPLYHTL